MVCSFFRKNAGILAQQQKRACEKCGFRYEHTPHDIAECVSKVENILNAGTLSLMTRLLSKHNCLLEIFKRNPTAWSNFQSFPSLYQKVRIDNIQRVRGSDFFEPRLAKLIEASEQGKMIGDWNDCGRLLEY